MRTAHRGRGWTAAGARPRVEHYDHTGQEAALRRIETLARVMDSVVTIPGTGLRIGVDPLLGMVPVVGDIAAKAISTYIIWEARRIGASNWTIARMFGNSLLDLTVGAIPIVGDAFDVVFRANLRNLALLKDELEKRGTGRGPVIDG